MQFEITHSFFVLAHKGNVFGRMAELLRPIMLSQDVKSINRQTSDISLTLVGSKIVD